jgi:nucleotide-binding universal stress UspA family protein
MPRFTKILCPVDFDQNSLAALQYAGELASEEPNATLVILHVVPIPPGPEVAIPFEKLEGRARLKLQRLVEKRLSPKIPYTLQLRTGDPAGEVIYVAEQSRADLIVIATHGRKGLRRFVLGSVAERVVREAPCAVLTVKPEMRLRGARPNRIPAIARSGSAG